VEGTVVRKDDALELLTGVGQIAVTVAGAPVLRRWYQRWGVSDEEHARSLPGDELVPDPDIASTRAVTVAASPEEVWPWLVQIGHGRGGLYSFDALENLIGCDLHSAVRVLPEHQHLEVGDLVRAGPEGYPAWCVVRCDPPRTLVLVAIAPGTSAGGRVAVDLTDDDPTRSTWQWVLEPTAEGGTRLLTRTRTRFPRSTSVLWHLLEPVTFVMERRMLLGIRERAERAAAQRTAAERAAAERGAAESQRRSDGEPAGS
jgi:hypothetical protein